MLDLVSLRRAAGLSQTAAAARMGIPQTAVSRLERQSDWKVSTLVAYLEALGADTRLVVEVGEETITLLLTKPRRKGR
jgi:transcriptional regulator with XRE-family HTH domain